MFTLGDDLTIPERLPALKNRSLPTQNMNKWAQVHCGRDTGLIHKVHSI